jgi:type VI secretion system protein ImpA
MATEVETADLEAMLAPIPGDRPTGIDVRENFTPSSIYFRLRDARSDARDAERQADSPDPDNPGGGGGNDDALQSKWRPVAALAASALKEATKDLEIATWLTEALVRTSGLAGLTIGAGIIGGLCERYWDDVFPMPDDAGMETRVAAIAGLSGQGVDGTLMQPLRKSTLFLRPDGSPFTLWQYQSALELSSITDPERRAARVAAGTLPFEDVEKEARLAGAAHWAAQHTAVGAAMAAWEAMGRVLDEKAGSDSPSGVRVRDALQLILDTCIRFAPAGQAQEAPTAGDQPVAAETAAAGPVLSGTVANREQALRQLAAIAEWFKRNEPNSPLGYTLDEAVRRGRMAWPDLVAELIADETSRSSLLISLGMKRPDAQ